MYLKSILKKWSLFFFLCMFLISVKGNAQKNEETLQLNDAQIAHIAVIANQIDVDYGKLALKKSDNAEVQQFAKTMINDHQAIIEQATALAKKLGVTPENNDVSKSLMNQQKAMVNTLENTDKKNFTKVYIDNEVAYHRAVIDAVKNTLIPQTENAELKGTLEKVMPLLEHHLQMAVDAQKRINQ